MRDFSAAEREEMRRLETNLRENIGQPPPDRTLVAQPVAIDPAAETAPKGKVPQVGIFFLVNGKFFVDGLAWTEASIVGRFKPHGVSHREYWQRLQGTGAVPSDMQSGEAPRGRVNYDATSRRFTVFADRCIIMDNRLVHAIMNELNLPMGTRGVVDGQYRCPNCVREQLTRKQEEKHSDS